MHVHLCVCVCVCMHTSVHARDHVSTCLCVCVYVHACLCVCACLHVYASCVRAHVCIGSVDHRKNQDPALGTPDGHPCPALPQVPQEFAAGRLHPQGEEVGSRPWSSSGCALAATPTPAFLAHGRPHLPTPAPEDPG